MLESFINLLFIRKTRFLYLSFFLFACAVGINLVTFPSLLKLHKVSAFQVGLAFTFEVAGVGLMSFFINKIANRYNIIKVLTINTIVYCSIILSIFFYFNYFWWLLMVFVLGCCWLTFVIIRMSWLNYLVSNEDRGVALGIFSALISAGVAIGPVIVSFVGSTNYLSFAISAILVILSFISLFVIRDSIMPEIDSEPISLIKFYKKNPNSFLSRFFLDFTTYTVVSLAVIFGTLVGFSNENSGLLITAYMASGFFDIFVGFMLKKVAPKKLINIGYLGCLCCFLLVSLYQGSFIYLLTVFFIFGLFIACIYVSVFKMMNEDYSNSELVGANATFQLVGTLGSLFGSLIGGFMIEIFGAQGFPILICFGALFYLTFLVIYEKK